MEEVLTMKITKHRLTEIIKEEIINIMKEKIPIYGDQSKYRQKADPNPEIDVVTFTDEGENFVFDGEEIFTRETDEAVTLEFSDEERELLKKIFNQ